MPKPGLLQRPHGGSPEEAESNEDGPPGPELEGSAFRISVDLSEYFQQPSRCFLWVPRPRETRTVRWLARRLRATAALRSRFCLLCAAHALPPDEPLRLLRPGDALRVVRVEHEWQRVFSFRGERLPPVPSPKKKKRHHIDAVNTEPPLTRVPEPKPKPSHPPSESLPSPQLATPLEELSFDPSELSMSLSEVRKLTQVFTTSRLPASPSVESFPPSALPKLSPALSTPKSAIPTPLPKTSSIKPPSQDEQLQRVKRRALALLQKVEGTTSVHSPEGGTEGGDEPDGTGEEWPPKKRRRRVRRRRALPPIDFEQEMALTTAQTTPAQTVTEIPVAPKTPLSSTPEFHSTPANTHVPYTPAPTSLPSVFAPPPIPVPSLSLSPSGPVVMREAAAPRPPRLVRALDSARSDDVKPPPTASTTPSLLPQIAGQCSLESNIGDILSKPWLPGTL